MNNRVDRNERGIALGVSLIALLAVLLAASLLTGTKPGPMRAGIGTVVTGIYLIAWGGMFLAAYYLDHKTFFFRALIWVCERMSSPKGRGMAFFYAALCFVIGVIAVLHGVGVFEPSV